MDTCTICKEEAQKTAKMNFALIDGSEIKVRICETCAGKIDTKQFYVLICRSCGAVAPLENRGGEPLSISVQDECSRCMAPTQPSFILPLV
jgi:hypothetical protein